MAYQRPLTIRTAGEPKQAEGPVADPLGAAGRCGGLRWRLAGRELAYGAAGSP